VKLYARVALYLLLVVMSSVASAAWCAARVRDGDPGTIGSALAQPDGARVTLMGEQVMSLGRSGKSFAVKEPFERQAAKPRLVVVSRRQLPVKEGWSVSATGVLSTLSGAARDGTAVTQRVLVVSPQDVLVACAPNGRPVLFAPVKHWSPTRPLLELAGSIAGSVSVMDEGELPPMPDEEDSESPPPAPGSRDSLKWLADGEPVSLNGIVVSLAAYGFFYAEKTDRSFGIKVNTSDTVSEGELVNVSGYMATDNGERAIVSDANGLANADPSNTYPRPMPLGMTNKALGGGAVGDCTPAVADAVGTNNTGLMVRTWGTVASSYIGTYYTYYIDDGSSISAGTDPNLEAECTGIKVYDLTWDWPNDGDYVRITGVSGATFQDSGSPTSIRMLWKTYDVTPSTQPGTTASVTGTITAAGASGKTVTVCSAYSSTTATFSGNTASYTLHVPAGDSAITASVVGYQTTTHLASVSNGGTVTRDFTLAPIPTILEVTSSAARIPPDGASEMEFTAVARDQEGRRLPNEPVTWNVDLGTIVSSDSTTNAIGEAHLILRAPSQAGTATISVTVGGVTVRCYAEYADADAPSIHIVSPGNVDTVGGDVEIQCECWDYYGTHPGIASISILVDGIEIDNSPGTPTEPIWHTTENTNGTHQITAAAWDYDGNEMHSNTVSVTVQNTISEVTVSPSTVGANVSVNISARLSATADWEVSVLDMDDQQIWSTTGSGTVISATWPGTSAGGLDTVSICAAGATETRPVAVNPTEYPQVLVVAEEKDFMRYEGLVKDIAKIAKRKNLTTKILLPNEATWQSIKPVLANAACQYFFIYCHGDRWGGPPYPLGNLTYLKLAASKHILYSRKWPNAPEEGEPDPNPNPAFRGWKVAYAKEELQRTGPLKLAWIEACLNGHNGAYRSSNENDLDYGKYGRYSCYEVSGWNDMADALGITPLAAATVPCAYVAYYDVGPSTDSYVGGGGIPGMTVQAWSLMADGRTFAQTRDWIDDPIHNTWYYKVPKPDRPHPTRPGYYIVAPFYNWRFWGNANVSLF